MALGDQAAAEKQWRAAIADNPSFGPASMGLIDICHSQGRKTDVEQIFRSLREVKADPAITAAAEARMRAKEGDIAGACRILADALDEGPRTVWLRVMLSDLLLNKRRNREAAVEQLRRALAIAPNNLDVQRRLAKLRTHAESDVSIPGNPSAAGNSRNATISKNP